MTLMERRRSVFLIAKWSSREPRKTHPRKPHQSLRIDSSCPLTVHHDSSYEPWSLQRAAALFRWCWHHISLSCSVVNCPFALVPPSHQYTATAAAWIFFRMGRGICRTPGSCGRTTWRIWRHLFVISPDFSYNIVEGVIDIDTGFRRCFDKGASELTG